MAMYGRLKAISAPKLSAQAEVDKHFSGNRAAWRPPYERLVKQVRKFGSDTSTQVGKSYISLLRDGKKFAI
jgi:hypothetical protein